MIGILIATVIPVAAHSVTAGVDLSAGWIVGCDFSHRSMNDPIVMPGMTSMSHSHDFFGNETTNADSTLESLLGKSTTCNLVDDTAAYWTPTLYRNGKAIKPSKAAIYYRTQVFGSVVQPFPAGLKMIAGDSQATGAQPINVVYYNCHEGPDEHHAARPYDCPGSNIDAHVRFPQCWDGVGLDSTDHKRHMSYPSVSHGEKSCPASHPVVVPRLIMRISWPISRGNRVRLASGPSYTLHADFFNAWTEATLGTLVDLCINDGVNCGKQSGSAISTSPVR